MATLQIRKKSTKVWAHVPSDGNEFILSKLYAKTDANNFKIVEDSGSNRKEYDYTNITVYDDTAVGTPETFASAELLMLRLEELSYVGFNRDGEVPTFNPADYDLDQFNNDNTDPFAKISDIGSGIDVTASHNKGYYNASTNSPSLSNGTGQIGDYYTVSVAGSRDFGAGVIAFVEGERVEYNGSIYFKAISTGGTTPLASDTVSGTVKTDVLEADPIVYTKASVDALLATLGGNDLYKSWFWVASSTEAAGLLFSGIVAINRFTETGTRTFITPTGTTRLLSLYFQNYLSATPNGSNCGVKQINNGDGIIRQGFDVYIVFGNNDTNTSCATSVGSYGLLSAVPNLDISAFTTDFFGVGNDVGDTDLSFYCKRTTATTSFSKVATNSSFPAHTTTDAYMLRMEAPQTEVAADVFIKLTLTNLITGAVISHTFTYLECPTLEKSLITTVNRSSRNTGVATNIKFGKIHVTRKMY